MSRSRRIAIVGAGVAGLSLAILATRRGFQVSVYERNSTVASMGAGVTLWSNAMYVLRKMGVDSEIERAGGAPDYMHQYDQQGTLQGEFDIQAVNALSGFTSTTVLRRDLIQILARRLQDLGGQVYFGCTMTREKIDVLRQGFDLVVGADGRMNSVARQALFSDSVSPRYQGFINIIGISQLGEHRLANAIHDIRGVQGRFGIVPVKEGACYWAAAWRAELDKTRPVSDWYDEMDRRFGQFYAPVQSVLNAREASSLKRIFVHDLDPLPRWHRGNLVIIGDAAHAPLPTSGQGACQALEDAWHLACLLGEKSELEEALENFYQRRIAKVTAAQNVGRQLAQRIFAPDSQAETPVPAMSPQQLNDFWMQGLERD